MENSGDRDDPEELKWIPEGNHYADVRTNVTQGTDLPNVFALRQNYPNPFTPAAGSNDAATRHTIVMR